MDADHNLILRDFNEKYADSKWSDFQRTGPDHMPIFIVELIVNDSKYVGKGSTKKKAKIDAIIKSHLMLIANDASSKTKKRKRIETDEEYNTPIEKKISASVQTVPKSAVSILHELFVGEKLIFEQEKSHGLLETMSVVVHGCKFIGYGQNKKEAKEIASRNALKAIFASQPIDERYKDYIEMLKTDYEQAKFIDHFALMTDIIYQSLPFDDHKYKEYCVIASIIKVR